jgi:hypothetical protein
MKFTTPIRKFTLTLHVISSVGWFGAVATFLALAVAGLTTEETQLASATYLAIEVIATFIIVPLCLTSLLTGIVQSLGTKWGLFRHYWVLIKLIITLLATILLLIHMRPIFLMSDIASGTVLAATDFRELRVQLVVDAGAALVALLITTVLSVYKPQGVTPYGWRQLQKQRNTTPSAGFIQSKG